MIEQREMELEAENAELRRRVVDLEAMLLRIEVHLMQLQNQLAAAVNDAERGDLANEAPTPEADV